MANLLEKLLGLEKTSKTTQSSELRKLNTLADNLVFVPKSREHPAHLVAHGRILHEGKPVTPIRTAINKRGDDIEFSTNFGQLPNNSLGEAIKDRLSHLLDGKFVTFGNQNQRSNVDLVYATRKPFEWLNRDRFLRELENHAKTQDLVSPVLTASQNIGQTRKKLNYSTIKAMGQDIVDSNLGLQKRLSNKLVITRYVPSSLEKKKP